MFPGENLIRKARRSRAISQQELAERLHITQGRVSYMETRAWPDLRLLHRCGLVLGYELHVSFTDPATGDVIE